ncbi:hypothetical protein NP233_g10495 [Leucocoprinus birnbaumii]|uniref:Uncharacterized protein n=1 Tax=Leucocoprinus birnbaumii TaxID=56174 RepID=A0AAD5YPT0_9AGAR|nr:hypothetical protein NP233_g10495 [Leucocoprinus birnbaumii]
MPFPQLLHNVKPELAAPAAFRACETSRFPQSAQICRTSTTYTAHRLVWLYGCRASKDYPSSGGQESTGDADMAVRRDPPQVGKDAARSINAGRINFAVRHLSATAITDRYVVSGGSVGATPESIHSADKATTEANTQTPNLEDLHNISHLFVPPDWEAYVAIDLRDRINLTCNCNIVLDGPEIDKATCYSPQIIVLGSICSCAVGGIGDFANSIIGAPRGAVWAVAGVVRVRGGLQKNRE